MEALETIDLGYDTLVPTNSLTLKGLPNLKSIVSHYAKEREGSAAPANYGKFVFDDLPALELVQLNGTSLLNGDEYVFQNLPKLHTLELVGTGYSTFSRLTLSSR